jgi:hypothetical protein
MNSVINCLGSCYTIIAGERLGLISSTFLTASISENQDCFGVKRKTTYELSFTKMGSRVRNIHYFDNCKRKDQDVLSGKHVVYSSRVLDSILKLIYDPCHFWPSGYPTPESIQPTVLPSPLMQVCLVDWDS